MSNTHTTLSALFTAIADAIRAKKGTTGEIVADNFPAEIAGIETGNEVEQATPSITVSSGGLITASATQAAGKVAAGTKSATRQLTTQASKTVTPNRATQTAIGAGMYTTGAIRVAPGFAITNTMTTTSGGTLPGTIDAYVEVTVSGELSVGSTYMVWADITGLSNVGYYLPAIRITATILRVFNATGGGMTIKAGATVYSIS